MQNKEDQNFQRYLISQRQKVVLAHIQKHFREFEKNISQGVHKNNCKEAKKIRSYENDKLFGKTQKFYFREQLKFIINGLKGNTYEFQKLKPDQISHIWDWLQQFLECPNIEEFLNKSNAKQKRKVFCAIRYIVKESRRKKVVVLKQIENFVESLIERHDKKINYKNNEGLNKSSFDQHDAQFQTKSMQITKKNAHLSQSFSNKLINKKVQTQIFDGIKLEKFEEKKEVQVNIEEKEVLSKIKQGDASETVEKSNLRQLRERNICLEQTKRVLSVQTKRCPFKACRKQLQFHKCREGNHNIVACDSCEWNEHICMNIIETKDKQNYIEQLNIKSTGHKIKRFDLERLTPMKHKNNILEVLGQFGYQYIQSPKIVPGTILEFKCNYPVLPTIAREKIYENRKEELYLPLKIKNSSIDGAGLGVFATENIDKPDTLICSYLGELGIGSVTPAIRSHNGVQELNNSFFTLGWFNYEILLMAPNLFCNVGRFINFNQPDKCNLKAAMCLVQLPSGAFEIVVILTSTRRIQAGEQLFYNYGKKYTNQ